MTKIGDIAYGNDALQTLDLYFPEPDVDNGILLIHFHGGGLIGGNKAFHRYIDDLLSFGYTFADCNYRLFPKVTREELLHDSALAVKKALDSIPKDGRHKYTFIVGESAGGYIVMELAFRRNWLSQVGIDKNNFTGYVFDDPMYFSTGTGADLQNGHITDALENSDCPLSAVTEGDNLPSMYFLTYGKSLHTFPEFTHMAVATLFRLGYGDKMRFTYIPGFTHCGCFEAPNVEGKNMNSVLVDRFYRSVIEERK